MGIKGLSEYLKDKCPDFKQKYPFSFLRGQKIAVDATGHIIQYSSVIHGDLVHKLKSPTAEVSRREFTNRLIEMVVGFFIGFLRKGILPIAVVDGFDKDQKKGCMDERKKKRVERQEKLSTLVEEYEGMLALDRTEEHDKAIRKMKSQDHHVKHTEMMQVIEVLRNIGIPVIQAPGDAEKMCASLCIEGLVSCVLSRDSDSYTFGATLTVLKYDLAADVLEVADLGVILSHFMETFECSDDEVFPMFVDFCILCGCDYNERLDGVGPAKALKLIKQYRSADNIGHDEILSVLPKTIRASIEPGSLSLGCYNVEECRQIFGYAKTPYFNDQLTIDWGQFLGNAPEVVSGFDNYSIQANLKMIDPSVIPEF